MKNLQSAAPNDFNVIVKDDCSPKQDEIENIVRKYSKKVSYELVLHKNKSNLGYDRNLLDAFYITDADYIFLLSDDDFIDGFNIYKLSNVLSLREHKIYYTPYKNNDIIYRNGINSFNFKKFHEVIYNSILFSGLIFDRKSVLELPKNEEFLSNCIYTQVYLASVIAFNEQGFGEAPSDILHLGGDGENFFGKNQSAINKDILRNRNSVASNLRYQMFLLSVVEKISDATDPAVLIIFQREYNRRMVSYLLRAREGGLPTVINLIGHIKYSGVNFYWYIKPVSYFIIIIPAFIAGAVNRCFIKLFRKAG